MFKFHNTQEISWQAVWMLDSRKGLCLKEPITCRNLTLCFIQKFCNIAMITITSKIFLRYRRQICWWWHVLKACCTKSGRLKLLNMSYLLLLLLLLLFICFRRNTDKGRLICNYVFCESSYKFCQGFFLNTYFEQKCDMFQAFLPRGYYWSYCLSGL